MKRPLVPPDQVTLDVATQNSAPALANLLELYCHDMSEIFSLELGPDGRFGYGKLSRYWAEPDSHFAFFIRCGGDLAGFALVTRGSPATDDPQDLDMAEFFILRSHRRSGVGRTAAFLLWDRFSGQWIVRVAEANRAGVPFWEGTIRAYTQGAYTQAERPEKAHVFRVFSFRSKAKRPI